MKRALVALVAVGFVVVAVSIARGHTGESQPSEAQATTRTPADVSKNFDRELMTEQIEHQADQVLRAQGELNKQVDAHTRGGSHTLVVTIREERPGDVWVPGKVAGKPACVTPPKDYATFINVTAGVDGIHLVSKTVPLEATLLDSGACQTTLEIHVHPLSRYVLTMSGPGNGGFEPVAVRHSGSLQRVTVVG